MLEFFPLPLCVVIGCFKLSKTYDWLLVKNHRVLLPCPWHTFTFAQFCSIYLGGKCPKKVGQISPKRASNIRKGKCSNKVGVGRCYTSVCRNYLLFKRVKCRFSIKQCNMEGVGPCGARVFLGRLSFCIFPRQLFQSVFYPHVFLYFHILWSRGKSFWKKSGCWNVLPSSSLLPPRLTL